MGTIESLPETSGGKYKVEKVDIVQLLEIEITNKIT